MKIKLDINLIEREDKYDLSVKGGNEKIEDVNDENERILNIFAHDKLDKLSKCIFEEFDEWSRNYNDRNGGILE